MRSLPATSLLFLFSSALAGCESVPDLTFADVDSSSTDAQPEAAASDARADAEPEGGACTGSTPGGANVCCTTTWCGGSCSPTDCASCLAMCPNQECCNKNARLTCKATGLPCPP